MIIESPLAHNNDEEVVEGVDNVTNAATFSSL